MNRKSWAVLVMAAVMVMAVGCGKSAPEPGKNTGVSAPAANNTKGTTPSNNSSTTPTTPAAGKDQPKAAEPVYEKVTLGPLKMGETAKVGPLSVTVKEFASVEKAAGLPPNYAFVVLNLTIKNDGKDNYTINATDHFKMETPEAKIMTLSPNATAQKSPRLQGTIEAGGTASGWLGYMVKIQPGNFKYRYVHPDWGTAHWEFAIR